MKSNRESFKFLSTKFFIWVIGLLAAVLLIGVIQSCCKLATTLNILN